MTRLPIPERPYIAQELVGEFGRVALLFAHPVDHVFDFFELLRVRRPRACRDYNDVLQVTEELLLDRLFQFVEVSGGN